jgi:hypothetical protein
VLWDKAVFTDSDGAATGLVDGSSIPIDPDAPMGAARLLDGERLAAALYPARGLHVRRDRVVDWKSDPLIPNMPGIAGDRARADSFARSRLDTKFTVELPVEVGGAVRRYVFVFSVSSYHVESFVGS